MSLENFLKAKYKAGVYTGSEIPQIERVPTGILGVDVLLGGGLPMGRIIEFYGRPSCGKSAICLAIAAELQRTKQWPVLYLDLERTVDPALCQRAGIDENLFYLTRPAFGEEALQQAHDGMEHGVKLVIVDSVPMLTPKADDEKLEKDFSANTIGALARMLSKLKTILVRDTEQYDATVLLINQIRNKIDSRYGGTTSPGGYALHHMCSARLKMYQSKDKDEDGCIHSNIEAEKNKVGLAGMKVDVTIRAGVVDRLESLLVQARAANLIVLSGAHYKLDPDYANEIGKEPRIGNGIKRALKYLSEEPELCRLLYEETLKRAREQVANTLATDVEFT